MSAAINVSLEKSLRSACRRGDLDAVKASIMSGANVNTVNSVGQSALMLSIRHPRVVNTLLQSRGIDVFATDCRGSTALMYAVCKGASEETIKSLIRAAKARGGAKAVATYVKAQNIYGNTPLIGAADKGHTKAVSLLIRAIAVKPRRRKAIKAYVNAQNDIGDSALIRAAYKGHVETFKLLRKAGADIDMRNYNGYTPIW